MENVNSNVTGNSQVVSSFSKRLFLKMSFIGLLVLLLFIPTAMVENMVESRQRTASDAKDDVYQQWGYRQVVTAPTIKISRRKSNPKLHLKDKDEEELYLLPNEVNISANIDMKELKRGIYEIVTYNAPITIKGDFLFSESDMEDIDKYCAQTAEVSVCLSDLKGVSGEIALKIGDDSLSLIPNGEGISTNPQLSAKIDISQWRADQKIPFEITLDIKGSESLKFVPVGKVTNVHLTSNSSNPSFCGEFLPENRKIDNNGFSSDWSISYINRNYPQKFVYGGNYAEESYFSTIHSSSFGVDLLIPVQHYQKTTRCVKYEVLFVFLTFALFFFIEMIQKKQIHAIQYILVGLALVLFYSLLLSFSEHIGFTPAYFAASLMTILMLTAYVYGILKIKKTAYSVGASLAGLYLYIFVLIQMETYALLAGSLGLFFILAALMYFSQRINWDGK